MKVIWKFAFAGEFNGVTLYANLGKGAEVVHVGVDPGSGYPAIWIMHDPNKEQQQLKFQLIGTGTPIPDGLEHVGSVIISPYVWHVFMGDQQ